MASYVAITVGDSTITINALHAIITGQISLSRGRSTPSESPASSSSFVVTLPGHRYYSSSSYLCLNKGGKGIFKLSHFLLLVHTVDIPKYATQVARANHRFFKFRSTTGNLEND